MLATYWTKFASFVEKEKLSVFLHQIYYKFSHLQNGVLKFTCKKLIYKNSRNLWSLKLGNQISWEFNQPKHSSKVKTAPVTMVTKKVTIYNFVFYES